jgi:hypothetical protein
MATPGPKPCGLIIGLFISILAACGTFDGQHTRETDDAMAALMGKGRDDVIAAWGLPAAVLDGENGDRLMVYSNEKIHVSGQAFAGKAFALAKRRQNPSRSSASSS